MKYFDKKFQQIKHEAETDLNIIHGKRIAISAVRAAPRGILNYCLDKFPIIGWLPRYDYRWIVNDVVAGLTLGIMLVPQSLAYAKIATIPVEHGLMSSFLPATIYAFMGTTKDLSTGPTSLIGLLTAEIVHDVVKDGYTPAEIASAVALMMGVYGMALGFLKLGFLLDFVSYPTLTGFISAVAIVIMLGQVDSLIGEENVGDGTAKTIHDVFTNLGTCNGRAAAIGISGVILLVGLQKMGEKWGKTNKIIWFISICRAFVCLVLFTGISYGVNGKYDDPDDYLFEVSKVKANGIEHPKLPANDLIAKVSTRSIAVFVAAAVEHIAIARAFSQRNNYVSDPSQELCYFGVTNFVNSFFHVMGVGGAMSRTAVNSSCNVRSPLSGFVTTGVILLSIYKLTGALYWIPKATLAAIIITAVWPLMGTWATYYKFYRTSLTDFIAAMLAFWLSLFVTTEVGIATAVGWSIVYCLLRQVFKRVTSIGSDSRSELTASIDAARGMPPSIPDDVRMFRFNESFFFPNAVRLKSSILDIVQTYHAPSYSTINGAERDRNWSVVGEKRVAWLRRKAGIDESSMPPIRLVILDFQKVNHTDTTACMQLKNFFVEIKKYAGESAEIRFVGVAPHIKERFERGGFVFVDHDASMDSQDKPKGAIGLYRSVADAVKTREPVDEVEVVIKGADEGTVSHVEEKKE